MEKVKKFINSTLFHIAGFINYWTKGLVRPAYITAFTISIHLVVAWALYSCRPIFAGSLLLISLFISVIANQLANIQNNNVKSYKFFVSISDSIKEIVIFSAISIFAFKHISESTVLWQITAVLGTSMLINYIQTLSLLSVKEKYSVIKFNDILSSSTFRMIIIALALMLGWLDYILPLVLALNLLIIALQFLVVAKLLYQKELKKEVKTTLSKPKNKK
jgi:hypothetical protein